jgi:DNA-binding XRE family transcriptional regulator
MTLNEALKLFGRKASLARALGISRQIVNRWDEDKPIPERYDLKLKYEIIPNLGGDRARQKPTKETAA